MKMLFHCTRFHISIFILFSLYQACYAPQRFFPSMGEFIMEEGETLTIRYKYEEIPLKFVYPNALGQSIDTSKNRISYQKVGGTYNFTRRNTVFGDTGWYGCTLQYFKNSYYYRTSTNSGHSKMDWLYVYVKSDTNLFVEAHTNVQLSAIIGDSIVIPCRTTWPNLKPKLIKDNKHELNDVPFDPKIGFTIRNLSLEDSNRYECSIEKNGRVHAVSYILSILLLPEPKIQVNDLFITRGENLKINCTVEIKLSMEHKFDWNIPQQNNSKSKKIPKFIKHFDANTDQVTSELTIFNVTDEDEGNYECITRLNDLKKIKKHIKIYDPEIKRIKFLPEFDTLYFQRKSGDNFELTIYVVAFLDTYTEWLNMENNRKDMHIMDPLSTTITEYYDSNGLNSSYIKTVSSLKINYLDFSHSVNYTIQAKNGYTFEMMNFTLDVIGKPEYVFLRKEHDFPYLPKTSTKFHCAVNCNPRPKITWSFLKCPNYPSLDNSTLVHLTDLMQETSYHIQHESIVKMITEVSGKITCEACNDQGCDNKTEDIIVYDPKPPFFVKTNMNKTKRRTIDVITEGHNTVILQCFVGGMPQPTVTWYKDNRYLEYTDQYDFMYDNQELHIQYMNLQDSGNYSCLAKNAIGNIVTHQQIVVKNKKWFTLDIALLISIPIVGFILAILAFSFTTKIYREKEMRRNLMEIGLMNFEEGALQCLDPNLTVDDQVELLPYDKKWEFPNDRLILKEQLGSGHFGMVFKAEAIGICKNEDFTTVAVKTVPRTTDPLYIRALANELKIMVHLGKHLNVVNLLGAYTKNIFKRELLMIVEYCRFGNLHDYLLKHRNDFINQINPESGQYDFTIGKDILTRTVDVDNENSLNANSDINMTTHSNPETNSNSSKTNSLSDCVLSGSSSESEWRPNNYNDNKDHNPKPFCTKDLLSWAFQVARGMEYLSQRKILHGDLAARNILLAEDNVVKICDFGLAKNIYEYGNYKKKSDIPIPIKWMAIESIRDRIFSTQSDVWSFGIMLWEFFTLAETPYPGMEEKKQYQKLVEGYRMEQPDYTTREVYDIMLQCWETEPMLRPTFTDLVESIGNLLEESMHYITLNNSYVDINTMNFKNGENDYLMMMSAPDHAILSLPNNKCVNSLLSNETSNSVDVFMSSDRPTDESKIFIPHLDDSNIEDPSSILDSVDAIDLPMLKHDEDPYLKPINVHE